MAGKSSNLAWYWHRLRAMSPREIALHFRRRIYQRSDVKGPPSFAGLDLSQPSTFAVLRPKAEAPAELLEGLARETADILKGDWLFFGHLHLEVDDPPRWQCDYLVKKDLQSSQSGFLLDHRAQPGGADIKVIWEPNRWYQLVRLAQAAWLLEDQRAAAKCVEWLENWGATNRAYTGLNWTSGLETGIRLVNYTWVDALLQAAGIPQERLNKLRTEIVPAHQWYTWRYRSFGSSANNHLLGELAGVLLALVRWPQLAKISAPLEAVQAEFEREVLAQFASDGGNLEQGLGYHLFSFEFCWQSLLALETAGRRVKAEVRDRLGRAQEFFGVMKRPNAHWDYGDSDDAFVTPFFANEPQAAEEWRRWCVAPEQSPAISFFAGKGGQRPRKGTGEGWSFYPESGFATFQSSDWFLRWDLSPLGYLNMAPHGHLDALHFSLWFREKPIIIDPGTGCYHAEKDVRNYLADWPAHNGPRVDDTEPFPERRGAFLWGAHHPRPAFKQVTANRVSAELRLPKGAVSRSIEYLAADNALLVEDSFEGFPGSEQRRVTIKFAPDSELQEGSSREIEARSPNGSVQLKLGEGWKVESLCNVPAAEKGRVGTSKAALGNPPLETLVSSAFRRLERAPYLQVKAASSAARLQIVISSKG